MRDADVLTTTQQACIDRLYGEDHTLLVAGMGAGKTVCALTAIKELICDGVVDRVLVVAPLRVCQTVWGLEHKNWKHLNDWFSANLAVCCGSEDDRLTVLASKRKVMVINPENLQWLIKGRGKLLYTAWRPDGLLIDELSRFRDVGGQAFKALRSDRKAFRWAAGMTGTPVSEDWQGLYGMMLLVDGGVHLGRNKEAFLQAHFYSIDYGGYKWEIKPDGAEKISRKICDAVYTMEDYRGELPELRENLVLMDMPDEVRRAHDKMADDLYYQGVEAANAAVKANKLAQITSGFLYDSDITDGVRNLSWYKLAAVENWLLARKSNGGLVIVYWWERDLEGLINALAPTPMRWALMGGGNKRPAEEIVRDWNRGEIDVLLLHPRSAGHGLNLAQGGHDMLWLGPVWSRDLYTQTVARLWRRGQTKEVVVDVLAGRGSIDEVMWERMQGKADWEKMFNELLGPDHRTISAEF